jgi:hypothetical protein
MKEYYTPPSNPIVERCKFQKRNRHQGETVALYVVELRAIAEKCEFGDGLTTALRNRVAAGIRDERMQRRLFEEKFADLTLERVITICQAIEMANSNVQNCKHRLQHLQLIPLLARVRRRGRRHKENKTAKGEIRGSACAVVKRHTTPGTVTTRTRSATSEKRRGIYAKCALLLSDKQQQQHVALTAPKEAGQYTTWQTTRRQPTSITTTVFTIYEIMSLCHR